MMQKWLSKLLPVACVLMSAPSQAGDKIYSPIVERGEWEFESRLLFSHDPDPAIDGAQNHVFEIGYGVNDWWATAGMLEVEREPGGHGKATHAAWENVFQFTPQDEYWIDSGGYVELEKGLNGDDDEIEIKLLLEKHIYRWTATTNLILNKHFGDAEPAVKLGYNGRVKYIINPMLELGVEIYGEFGELRGFAPAPEQNHAMGPAVLGKMRLGGGYIKYDIAYLRGLTDATPRDSVQFNLEYEFRF